MSDWSGSIIFGIWSMSEQFTKKQFESLGSLMRIVTSTCFNFRKNFGKII